MLFMYTYIFQPGEPEKGGCSTSSAKFRRVVSAHVVFARAVLATIGVLRSSWRRTAPPLLLPCLPLPLPPKSPYDPRKHLYNF